MIVTATATVIVLIVRMMILMVMLIVIRNIIARIIEYIVITITITTITTITFLHDPFVRSPSYMSSLVFLSSPVEQSSSDTSVRAERALQRA